MAKLISDFSRGKERSRNPEYTSISLRAGRLNKKIEQEENQEIRSKLLDQKKVTQRRMRHIPSVDQQDPEYRRVTYGRYADDFVLGAICPQSEAEEIYRKIETFLKEERKGHTSQTKSGLKHNTAVIRFLGYDSTIKKTERMVKRIVRGQHCKQRTLKAQRTFNVPEAKMKGFADKNRYGNWITMQAIHRPLLSQRSDAAMAALSSAAMRGVAQFYALADTFPRLGRRRCLWIQSFLKTMGSKHQTSVQKVATMLNRGTSMAVRETGQEGKRRETTLFRLTDVKREALFESAMANPPLIFKYTSGSELSKRMDANTCAYCAKEEGYFEVHHVRKLADIKEGKQPWQQLMIARKRKTLVLCVDCHHRLTAGTLPDRRYFQK